jgi:PAS domain S-box-containing protein
MLAGTFAPWIGNALYVTGLSPFPNLDLTPFAFTLTGLAATWGLFRFQFMDVVPIARDTVIEGMRDGVLVLDKQNRIVDINPIAIEMLELTDTHMIGISAEQVLSPWSDLVVRYKDTSEIHEEFPLDEVGSQLWYDLQISPIHNRQGRWIGRLVVLRDITERKCVEQERERLIEELDAFAHTVAHDLKNPLTTISGYIQMLNHPNFSVPEQTRKQYMHTIENGSKKMYAIIEALLLLSEVRQQADIPVESLAMQSIVQEALKRLEPVIEQSSAAIILPDHWQTAVGFKMWVEEIWINYISNAIKYGGTPPQITLGSNLQSNGTVCFWVHDNGLGITPDDQAKLFIPFSRLEQREAEGHGLGLSIVERIVNKLGGQVAVDSVPGEGTTFSFTLPVVK